MRTFTPPLPWNLWSRFRESGCKVQCSGNGCRTPRTTSASKSRPCVTFNPSFRKDLLERSAEKKNNTCTFHFIDFFTYKTFHMLLRFVPMSDGRDWRNACRILIECPPCLSCVVNFDPSTVLITASMAWTSDTSTLIFWSKIHWEMVFFTTDGKSVKPRHETMSKMRPPSLEKDPKLLVSKLVFDSRSTHYQIVWLFFSSFITFWEKTLRAVMTRPLDLQWPMGYNWTHEIQVYYLTWIFKHSPVLMID